MAITKPEKVPPSKISSIDINSADAGLDQRGRESLRSNSFAKGYNVGINGQGQATTLCYEALATEYSWYSVSGVSSA